MDTRRSEYEIIWRGRTSLPPSCLIILPDIEVEQKNEKEEINPHDPSGLSECIRWLIGMYEYSKIDSSVNSGSLQLWQAVFPVCQRGKLDAVNVPVNHSLVEPTLDSSFTQRQEGEPKNQNKVNFAVVCLTSRKLSYGILDMKVVKNFPVASTTSSNSTFYVAVTTSTSHVLIVQVNLAETLEGITSIEIIDRINIPTGSPSPTSILSIDQLFLPYPSHQSLPCTGVNFVVGAADGTVSLIQNYQPKNNSRVNHNANPISLETVKLHDFQVWLVKSLAQDHQSSSVSFFTAGDDGILNLLKFSQSYPLNLNSTTPSLSFSLDKRFSPAITSLVVLPYNLSANPKDIWILFAGFDEYIRLATITFPSDETGATNTTISTLTPSLNQLAKYKLGGGIWKMTLHSMSIVPVCNSSSSTNISAPTHSINVWLTCMQAGIVMLEIRISNLPLIGTSSANGNVNLNVEFTELWRYNSDMTSSTPSPLWYANDWHNRLPYGLAANFYARELLLVAEKFG